MSSSTEAIPVTEIWYLEVDPDKDLKDTNSEAARIWYEILELSERQAGFQEQYWGRGLEEPTKVRLHIVRETLEQHEGFRRSESGAKFHFLLQQLIQPGSGPETHHVLLQDFTPGDVCLARHAPVTGTAIYLSSNEVFALYAWPLWTHIVRHAPGNKGVAGGRVLDHPIGEEAYLVYVGWESNAFHQEFRKSPLCCDRRIILTSGNKGQFEYYHIVFEKSQN